MERLAKSGDTFTEFDVANEASGQGTKGWNSKMFQQAVKDSYTVLQSAYKRGRLARYGPVAYKPKPTAKEAISDYLRRGTKILYADAQAGPSEFETPNGTFPRLLAEHDKMLKVGRKPGTNRDDTKPWAEQMSGPPIDTAPLEKRIRELEEEIARLRKAAQPVSDTANGNGGNGDHNDAPAWVQDAIERAASQAAERVREKIAEALIS